MKNIRNVLLPILTLLCSLALIGVLLSKDNLLIYVGARNFSTILKVTIVVLAASIVATVISFLIKPKQNTKVESVSFASENRLRASERQSLRSKLGDLQKDKWWTLESDLEKILRQLSKLEEYSDGLEELIKTSQNSMIDGTDDLVDRLRDCAYRNVKKLTNYLTTMPSSDKAIVEKKVQQCRKYNSELVHQAAEFTEAVVDYVNNSSDEEETRSLSLIESFKENILETIDSDTMLLQ